MTPRGTCGFCSAWWGEPGAEWGKCDRMVADETHETFGCERYTPSYRTLPDATPAEKWARVLAYVSESLCGVKGKSQEELEVEAREVYGHVYGPVPPEYGGN